ncbi:MAG: hypothetical protein JNK02_16910 [Planctomycetes bacterium]|nr:hypothetical protein [Planctomycetota bacterium]
MSRGTLLLALAALGAPACIAPSVVQSSGRAVALDSAPLEWRPATPDDVAGLFESASIEGEAAAALWRVWYAFAADGTYSGAALVLGETHPVFQTLSGSWTLSDGQLDLGDGQTAPVAAAEDHLRLEGDGGVVILRRCRVQ